MELRFLIAVFTNNIGNGDRARQSFCAKPLELLLILLLLCGLILRIDLPTDVGYSVNCLGLIAANQLWAIGEAFDGLANIFLVRC